MYEDKPSAGHNQDQACISNSSKNCKKAQTCFKNQEDFRYQKVAITNQVKASKCGDITDLINKDFIKQRFNELQYIKIVIECLQFLAH